MWTNNFEVSKMKTPSKQRKSSNESVVSGQSTTGFKMTIVRFRTRNLATTYCANQYKQVGSPRKVKPQEALPPEIESIQILG